MKLLNLYLVDLNTYPVFKKNRIKKLLDKKIVIFASVSLVAILVKILVEAWI